MSGAEPPDRSRRASRARHPRRTPSRLAFEIAGIYAVSGVAWILAPRDVVSPFVHTLTFAAPSVLLVFLLVRRLLERLYAAEAAAERAEAEVVKRLARVAEWKDDTLGGHNQRIARYCVQVAREIGLPEERLHDVYHGALLHDIGKVGVPDELLRKRDPLTPSEVAQMRQHVEIGALLLADSDDSLLRTAHTIALTHHERWDGTGYPAGLRGEEIPIEGRIAAVCDVFDALLSKRHYKEAWSLEAAQEYLRSRRGRDFDPEVVDALFRCVPALEPVKFEAILVPEPEHILG
ncbi:MAG: HD-GYP domain-containing protein [Fimbriimonas sp.]